MDLNTMSYSIYYMNFVSGRRYADKLNCSSWNLWMNSDEILCWSHYSEIIHKSIRE